MTSLKWTHWPLKSSRCLCHQTPPIKPGLWLNVKRINRLRAGVNAGRTCVNTAVLFSLLLMLHIHTELHKEPGTRSIHSLACGTDLFNVSEDGNLSRSVSLNCVNSQAPEQEKKPIRGKHWIRCPSELTRECWESQFHSCCKECYLVSQDSVSLSTNDDYVPETECDCTHSLVITGSLTMMVATSSYQVINKYVIINITAAKTYLASPTAVKIRAQASIWPVASNIYVLPPGTSMYCSTYGR